MVQLDAGEKEGFPGFNYTFGRNSDTTPKTLLICIKQQLRCSQGLATVSEKQQCWNKEHTKETRSLG